MAKERLEALSKVVGLPALLKSRREKLNDHFKGQFTQTQAGLKIMSFSDGKDRSDKYSDQDAQIAKNLVSSIQKAKPYPLVAGKEYLDPKKLRAVCGVYQLPQPLYELRNKHFLLVDVFSYLARNDSEFTVYLQPAEEGSETYASSTVIYTLSYLLLNRTKSTITICKRVEDRKMVLLLIAVLLLAEDYKKTDETLTDNAFSEIVIYRAVKEVLDRYENPLTRTEQTFPWKPAVIKPYLERIKLFFRKEGNNKEVFTAASQNPVSYWYYRSGHTGNDNAAFVSISETDFFRLTEQDAALMHSRFENLTQRQGYKSSSTEDHRFLAEIKKLLASELGYNLVTSDSNVKNKR